MLGFLSRHSGLILGTATGAFGLAWYAHNNKEQVLGISDAYKHGYRNSWRRDIPSFILHRAVTADDCKLKYDLIESLLKAGADPNFPHPAIGSQGNEYEGSPPLIELYRTRAHDPVDTCTNPKARKEITFLLLRYGANPYNPVDGIAPLEFMPAETRKEVLNFKARPR